MALERTFSAEYESQKEDARRTRRSRQRKGASSRRGLAAGIGEEEVVDVAYLRRDKALQPIVNLRRSLRRRLLEDGQFGKALYKAQDNARKNRKHGLDHCKGVHARTQREGRGKAELLDWDSMGGGRVTLSVDTRIRGQRKQETLPNSSRGSQATPSAEEPARILCKTEVRLAKANALEQLQFVHGLLEMPPPNGGESAKSLREAGKLPSTPAAHVSTAALLLLNHPKDNRPASVTSLSTFLKRRGCCDLRYNVLMPPGALANAMIPLLAESPLLQHALSPLTMAAGDGPMPDMLARLASERVLRLKKFEIDFLNWSFAARCRWLAHSSSANIRIVPSTLVAELEARHYIKVAETGKLIYNEDLLASETAPPDGEWMRDAFNEVTADAVVNDFCVHLGNVEALVEVRCVKFRKYGLKALGQKWKDEALKSCKLCKYAYVHAFFEPRRWPTSLHIITAFLGGTGSSSETFEREVRRAAEAEIRSISPLVVELRDITLRESLFEDSRSQISWLEKNLACKLATSGNHDLWAVFQNLTVNDTSPELIDKYRKVLCLAVSAEPVFRLSGEIPRSVSQALNARPGILHQISKDLGVHLEISNSSNNNGSVDLLCWPGFHMLSLPDGLDQYLAAAQTPLCGFAQLAEWSKGKPYQEIFVEDVAYDQELLEYSAEAAQARLKNGGKVVIGRIV